VNSVSEQIARRLGEYPAVSHTIVATSRCFGPGIELSTPAAPSSWAELGSPPIAAGAAPALLWTIYKFASKLILACLIEDKTEEEAIEISDIWNARVRRFWREPREWLGSPLARRFASI
jgi:hypothetical protein